MKIKILITIFFLSGAGYSFYHYFDETLMFSEIVGQSTDPTTNLLVGIFDFDTGLTRYDVYHLSGKSKEWLARMENINRIPDPRERERKTDILYAEMLQDRSFKKVAKKLFGLGISTVKLFLKVLI